MTGLADRRLTKTGRPKGLPATARPLRTDAHTQGTTCSRRRTGQTLQAAKPAPPNVSAASGVYERHARECSLVQAKREGKYLFRKYLPILMNPPTDGFEAVPKNPARSITPIGHLLRRGLVQDTRWLTGTTNDYTKRTDNKKPAVAGSRFGVALRQTRRDCPRFVLTTKFGIFDRCANRRSALPGVGCGDRI
jgi:hypothetical protein